MSTKYKNAFKCHKCPQSNDEDGCPMWWEIMETNIQTGEEKLTKDCGFQLMPKFLLETMKSGNRAAESAESHRNETVSELSRLVLATQSVSDYLKHHNQGNPQLRDDSTNNSTD